MRSLTIAFVLAFALPLSAWAQGALATISMEGSAAPRSSVRFILQSPGLDISGSIISWRVNGTAVASGEGVTSIETTLGAAGEATEVVATITTSEQDAVVSTTVTPATVDLLWESDGAVPVFYRGRTLAAPGTKLRLVAIPSFGTESNLIYTWKKSGTVLGTLSGKGKSTLTLGAPLRLGADTISVDVKTADGSIAATASTRIASIEAPVVLYVEHPLFGTLYHRALGASSEIEELEVTFSAVPYFAPARSLSDPLLRYEWRVNDSAINADAKRPSQITISASGSDGFAVLELITSNARDFFYDARGLWQITFGRRGAENRGNDPFAPQQ